MQNKLIDKDVFNVLEIGSGLNPQKDTTFFMDINKKYIKGDGIVHDANKIPYPFENETFDRIYMYNILEHLNCTDLVLKEIFRILKPRGHLCLKVPNFNCYLSRMNYLLGYLPQTMMFFHKNYFSYNSLIIKCIKSGFIVKMFDNINAYIPFVRGFNRSIKLKLTKAIS